jgi:hypothetical protein
MRACPVSHAVNAPKHNGPEFVAPLGGEAAAKPAASGGSLPLDGLLAWSLYCSARAVLKRLGWASFLCDQCRPWGT